MRAQLLVVAARGALIAIAVAGVGCGRLDFAPRPSADGPGSAGDAAVPDLVGWWKLDETAGSIATDASGNGDDGTLVKGPTWTTGRVGNGLALDGNRQYVDVPDAAPLRVAGSWTVAIWVQLSAIPANGVMYTLIAKCDAAGSETYSLRLDDDYGQFGSTAPGSFVAQFAEADGTDHYVLDTPTTLAAGTWYWLAGTWDAATSELALYLDGTLAASATVGTVSPTIGSGEDLLIGDNPGHLGQGTAGVVDDVRLYDRALTAGELATLYAGFGGGG